MANFSIAHLENDYMFESYNVTILAGNTVGLLDILIVNDYVVEGKELFDLTIDITSLPEGIFTGDPNRTIINILDSNSKLPSNIGICIYRCIYLQNV